MLEVKVVVTLAPEVLALVEGMFRGLGNSTGTAGVQQVVEDTQAEANVEQKEEKKSTLTLEELRAVAGKAIKANREKAKAILDEFGAKSVSTLEEEHYESFYSKIKELV